MNRNLKNLGRHLSKMDFNPDATLRREFEMEKQYARQGVDSSSSLPTRIRLRLLVARTNYEESYARAVRQKWARKHPGFSVYLAHWLEAGKHSEDLDVYEALARDYPAPVSQKIPKGDRYWRL